MQVGDSNSNLSLPKEKHSDAVDPFNFEPLTNVLKELTKPEQTVLEMMIGSKDEELLQLLKISAPEELTGSVLSLIRRKLEEGESGEEEEEKKEEENADEAFEQALEAIHGNKEALVKQSTKSILKILHTLKKSPEKQKSRRHRVDQIVVRKYIMEVSGALDFMKAVGFCETTNEKGLKYIEIEESKIDVATIDRAVEMIEVSMEQGKAPKAVVKAKAPAEKKTCVGGCGFWGDESQDFYCSQCYKSKMCGVKTEVAKPAKCTQNCGFYGAQKFNGMCSVCFFGKQAAAPPVVHWRVKFKKALLKVKTVRAFSSAPRLLQKKKNRCWQCKRKVGLLGIECRCGFVFCGKHRYADEHSCRFDHKGTHQKKLRKENQQVKSEMFEKI